MKYFFIGVGILVILIIGGIAIDIVMFPVNTAQKEINTAYQAQDQVLNGQNAIYNYEWFKQQYQDIQASKVELSNAQASYASYTASLPTDRSQWSYEDDTEVARLNSVVLGLENNLESNIADYDARASEATRNIFQDGVVPSYIDALTFIKQSN